MPKIDILVQNYPPERVAVHYTSDLAEAFANAGSDVRVITALPHAPTGKPYKGYGKFWPKINIEAKVKVWRVPVIMSSNRQLLKRILGFASFMISAAFASLLGRRPEIVIVSLPSIFIWPVILLLTKLRRLPVVLLMRDVEPRISFELRGVDQKWWAQVFIKLSNKLYSYADAIVLVHESQRVALPSYISASIPVEVIDHGVDVDRVLSWQQSSSGLRFERFHPDDVLILYTGTFGVAQDLAALLELVAHESIKNLPVSFGFVGDGEQHALLVRLKQEYSLDRVIIYPPVTRDEVPAILDQADVLLMSYKFTPKYIAGMIGSKFYEYCASGKPIFVFGNGVGSGLVQSIGNGWCCEANNVLALREKLQDIVADRDRYHLGARGREYAKMHFDKKQRHSQWTSLINTWSSSGKHISI